jgi:hypothetical protein
VSISVSSVLRRLFLFLFLALVGGEISTLDQPVSGYDRKRFLARDVLLQGKAV